MMDIWLFLFLLGLICRAFAHLVNEASGPVIPKQLLRLKAGFDKGKPHRRYWHTLRANPGFDDHYRRVPGRLSCTVLPYNIKGEDHWQLRVGFKDSADSRPSTFISIPVYSNGQILDV